MNFGTISPKLYIWKNSRLYIATKQNTFRKYTLAWSQILVSIQGYIHLRMSDGSEVKTKSCLIKAGTVVNEECIDIKSAVVAIYYINPISQDYWALESHMLQASAGVSFNHPQENSLVSAIHSILTNSPSVSTAFAAVREALIPQTLKGLVIKEYDPRILATLQSIKQNASKKCSVKQYADDVYLSESRLKKLFKEEIGIPLTKYRLQCRLSVGVTLLAAGYSVTDAAYHSGFSSTAHFSTCFSDMIGVQPSTPFLKPPFLTSFIDEDVLNEFVPNRVCQSG
jgi:AraC-like DNA-binding protein